MFAFAAPRARRRISLTPMIDVVFLLLVFFMLAARFGQEQAIPLAIGAGAGDWDGPPRLIDILPDEEPNCYNLHGRGSFPVLGFGNEAIGVEDIDPTSVSLEGMTILAKRKGRAGTTYGFFDEDEFLDMQVLIGDVGSLNNFAGTATLEALTFSGTPVIGSDELRDVQFCRDDD